MDQNTSLGECDYLKCKNPAIAEIPIIRDIPDSQATICLKLRRCQQHLPVSKKYLTKPEKRLD